MAKMLRLLSYDITDNKRRRHVVKLLEGSARRVQYSVFEAFMTESELSAFISKILPFILFSEGDSLLVYRLCGSCASQRRAWGKKKVIDWEEAIIV
jgi:CRISPR-associated protein Cas2